MEMADDDGERWTTGPSVSLAPHDCVGHDGAIDSVHHTDL